MNTSAAPCFDIVTRGSLEPRSPLPHEAWLGLGSNLGDRLGQIELVLQHFSSQLIEVSPIFETAPWGVLDQPWFLNGVARLHWEGSAFELLQACLDCETMLGRVRGELNGPRVIDLDVLVHGMDVLDQPGLTVPHPGISMRRSVLEPWSVLAPELVVPGQDCTLIELRERSLAFTDQPVRAFQS